MIFPPESKRHQPDTPADPLITSDVHKEMHKQLVASSTVSLWTIPIVIALICSVLRNELPAAVLSGWAVIALLDNAMVYVNYVRNQRQPREKYRNPAYVLRNRLHFLTVGIVWGILPLLNALYGSDQGVWLSLMTSMATMALITFMLGTSRTYFLISFIPLGGLMILGVALSNLPRVELGIMCLLFTYLMWRMHKLLYAVHRDRIQTALQNQAQTEALSKSIEFTDSLTGLLNKAGLQQWLMNEQTNNQLDRSVLLTVGSVMGFREINFMYGSYTADQLLVEMAKRLNQEARGLLKVARISGAEFVLADIRANATSEFHCNIFTLLEQDPIRIGDRIVTVGIQQSSVRGAINDIEHLIAAAEDSLQETQPEMLGTNHDIRNQLEQRRKLLKSFESALAKDQIQSWFQPIIDCKNNHIIGWEALARWIHPELGMLSPANFLEIARISRQTSLLTRMMFRASAIFAQQLISKGLHQAARVSVNFSASELREPSTLQWVQLILDETGASAQQIIIEISEKEALIIDEQFALNLYEMKRMGLNIAIDDFGTGFANLGHLLDLPASSLKIDKRFIDKLPTDRASVALVRGILTMAAGLGMRTVAEGVERPEQLQFLLENNCDAYQGFLAGVALPAKAAMDLAARWAKS